MPLRRGFRKTALIAYPLRQAADYVFELSALREGADGGASIPALLAWLGVAAYALQLYHGFSGYSDMSVGLCRMFGFAAGENFDHPYTARSVTDFWRRWHISLSDWFRTYLWPPFDAPDDTAGGRAARNGFVVLLCIGLWYGAAQTYIFWALWHFLWLTAERVTRFDKRNVPSPLRHLYVLFTIGIGWIFFRAPDLASAFAYLRVAFGLSRNAFAGGTALMLLREYWPAFLIGILFSVPLARFLGLSLPAGPAAVLRALALTALFFGGMIALVRAGGVIWV